MDLFSKFFAQISSSFGAKNPKLVRGNFWHVFDQMSKVSLDAHSKWSAVLQHILTVESDLEKRKTLYHTWDWLVLQGPVLLDRFQLTFQQVLFGDFLTEFSLGLIQHLECLVAQHELGLDRNTLHFQQQLCEAVLLQHGQEGSLIEQNPVPRHRHTQLGHGLNVIIFIIFNLSKLHIDGAVVIIEAVLVLVENFWIQRL